MPTDALVKFYNLPHMFQECLNWTGRSSESQSKWISYFNEDTELRLGLFLVCIWANGHCEIPLHWHLLEFPHSIPEWLQQL